MLFFRPLPSIHEYAYLCTVYRNFVACDVHTCTVYVANISFWGSQNSPNSTALFKTTGICYCGYQFLPSHFVHTFLIPVTASKNN